MDVSLTAQTGRPTGSRPASRLRAQGKVPGVVYGLQSEPVPVTVEWPELRKALTTSAGLNALIDLEVDGQTNLSVVKELQRDAVRRTVTHVDFLLIDRDAPLEVDVPLVVVGTPSKLGVDEGHDRPANFLLQAARPSHQIEVDVVYPLGSSVKWATLPACHHADRSRLTPGSATAHHHPPAGAGLFGDSVDPDAGPWPTGHAAASGE
jgi:ribosomal protein L25 (general stress protein Ctc)